MSVKIAKLERARNTRDGNPVYDVEFDDGSSGTTKADAQIGHYAENSEWQGVDLDVDWEGDPRAGVIRGWRLAE